MRARAGVWISLVFVVLCGQLAVAHADAAPSAPVAPSVPAAVAPAAPAAAAPSAAVAPSGSAAVAPSGSAAVAPSGSATAAPASAAAASPIAPSGNAAPAASSVKAPPFDPAKAAAAAQIADPEAATRAYLDAVSPERRAQTKAYAIGGYVLGVVDFAVSSVVLILLLVLGISVRFRNLAERITRFRVLQGALYWIQLLVVTTVAQLPLTLYIGYYREKHYDLLTQSLSGYLVDQAMGLVIGCIVGGILVTIAYAVLRRSPRLWWTWMSGVLIAFLVLLIAISPVVISPVFNKFTPIEDRELRARILQMAHDHGIDAHEVYQTDESQRTDLIGAYVNGMLGTMRIVMYDNTLKRCTPEEIQMIMGHEMGHYVLNHIWKGVALRSVLVVLGLLFVRWAFAWVLRRWPTTGIDGISDLAGLPLLLLLLSLFAFVAAPVVNSFGRSQESQADDFGLDASREPAAAATTFLKLGEHRDLDPSSLVEILFFDHP
ncbi:MAG TPA: M48 family metallopeptidase, partial [Kofleriaceae bacterium]|nr:M48 family metallopeptidase [Kofleriaceae bacterium]